MHYLIIVTIISLWIWIICSYPIFPFGNCKYGYLLEEQVLICCFELRGLYAWKDSFYLIDPNLWNINGCSTWAIGYGCSSNMFASMVSCIPPFRCIGCFCSGMLCIALLFYVSLYLYTCVHLGNSIYLFIFMLRNLVYATTFGVFLDGRISDVIRSSSKLCEAPINTLFLSMRSKDLLSQILEFTFP